ncbi:hypothetical protein Efla_002681 [Eimeria flavescens]
MWRAFHDSSWADVSRCLPVEASRGSSACSRQLSGSAAKDGLKAKRISLMHRLPPPTLRESFSANGRQPGGRLSSRGREQGMLQQQQMREGGKQQTASPEGAAAAACFEKLLKSSRSRDWKGVLRAGLVPLLQSSDSVKEQSPQGLFLCWGASTLCPSGSSSQRPPGATVTMHRSLSLTLELQQLLRRAAARMQQQQTLRVGQQRLRRRRGVDRTVSRRRSPTPCSQGGSSRRDPSAGSGEETVGPLSSEQEVRSWIGGTSSCRPWEEERVFDIPLPLPTRLKPDPSEYLAEKQILRQQGHVAVSAHQEPRPFAPLPPQQRAGLDAFTQPIDDNEEQFEAMLGSLVKVLVAKAVEQSVEEVKQEEQLHMLLQRKRALMQQHEKGLRALEEQEALKHLQAQQARQQQLELKEKERGLWRRLWIVHIASTFLHENTTETIAQQLDEEKQFFSSTEGAVENFVEEVAGAALKELQTREMIGKTLLKEWTFIEGMKNSRIRQQELLLSQQRKNRRKKFKRKRDIQRGLVHIFVAVAVGGPSAGFGGDEELVFSILLSVLFVAGLEQGASEVAQIKPSSLAFEDEAEMPGKAHATVVAASDLVQLHLRRTPAQEALDYQQAALQAEAESLARALEEEQKQLACVQERLALFHGMKQNEEAVGTQCCSSPSPANAAAICLGAFKVFRAAHATDAQKELVSLEQLLSEVQQKLCKYFSGLVESIRNMQIVIEVKGKKVSKVEALLAHEFGDIRVRFERKIKFADQGDSSGDEKAANEEKD